MRITSYRTELNNDNMNVLIKEKSQNYKLVSDLSIPQNVAKMMCDVYGLHRMAEEHLFQLAFNNKCKPLAIFHVSHGTVNSCCANVREVMIRNCLVGASSFLLVHNHPSHNFIPSKEDIFVTKRFKKAGELMGIALLDHIIIGNDCGGLGLSKNYYSMKEHEVIE